METWRSIYVIANALLAICLGLAFFRWIIPRYGLTTKLSYLMVFAIIVIVTALSYLLQPLGIPIDLLFIIVAVSVGLIGERKFTLHVTLMAALAEGVVILLNKSSGAAAVSSMALKSMVLLMVGLIANRMARTLIDQAIQTARKNRHLTLLLHVGDIVTADQDLNTRLTQMAQTIVHNVPVSCCRISVLDSGREQLTTCGAYPILPLEPDDVGIGSSYSLPSLPYLADVLANGQPCILFEHELNPLTQENDRPAFFYYGVKTLIIVPLFIQGSSLGLMCLGEVRSWQGSDFDDEKIHLLQTLANQTATAVQSHLALLAAQRQAQRLAVANEIGRAISSTIEMEALLELIYQQLKLAIPSDTYYVGIYLEELQMLEIPVMIDDGVRYAPAQVPLGDGLASWVLTNRQPLLVRSLIAEEAQLPARAIRMGDPRMSESWLGVPMIANDRVLGILAIASYKTHAFDEEDRTLLMHVAAQAALALDNARQHAVVKEQALRDSLTGAYNHGSLLHFLNEAVEHAEATPVSLIMLDIDFFKQYNDTYGHKTGDEVLRLLVQAILAHVKRRDIVGRWGGEEFAIGLPQTDSDQALLVAQRIRQTLTQMPLQDRFGHPIPGPTVSQGIATYPLHAHDSAELVDLADEALYRAKNNGRDQIALAKA